MAFKTIETQEQFDEAIKERLERESKKYEGYMSPSDVAKLQEDLCREEIYSNPSESERVNKEIKNLQDVIAHLYEKWEELSMEE